MILPQIMENEMEKKWKMKGCMGACNIGEKGFLNYHTRKIRNL